MTDVELLVRETLGRHEAEVPTLDLLDAHPLALRTRRRQVLNAVAAGFVALIIAFGAVTGVGALLRSDGKRPAIEPKPTPSPEAPQVGLVGLPPNDVSPSTPEVGELVISFENFCCPSHAIYVYTDGRVIWHKSSIVSPDHEDFVPLDTPQAANEEETGWLEQRLTPEGVELLRSELVSTGLFDEDSSFKKKAVELTMSVRNDDRLVRLAAASFHEPIGATPDQARAIERLGRIFEDLEAWLPDNAWADRDRRTFIPSRYSLTLNFYSVGNRTPDDPSELPSPADDFLRDADFVDNSLSCTIITTEEARAISADLSSNEGFEAMSAEVLQGRGVAFEMVGGEAPALAFSHGILRLDPLLPHEVDCSALYG